MRNYYIIWTASPEGNVQAIAACDDLKINVDLQAVFQVLVVALALTRLNNGR